MLQEKVNDKYFFCYDKNLSYYLFNNGCRYITKANNIKDGAQFALFEKTEPLRKLVDEWSSQARIKHIGTV